MTDPTAAELAVLHRLTQPGATMKSVAHELGITERAVKGRLQRLYGRLGVADRLQAWVRLYPPN